MNKLHIPLLTRWKLMWGSYHLQHRDTQYSSNWGISRRLRWCTIPGTIGIQVQESTTISCYNGYKEEL